MSHAIRNTWDILILKCVWTSNFTGGLIFYLAIPFSSSFQTGLVHVWIFLGKRISSADQIWSYRSNLLSYWQQEAGWSIQSDNIPLEKYVFHGTKQPLSFLLWDFQLVFSKALVQRWHKAWQKVSWWEGPFEFNSYIGDKIGSVDGK